MYRYIDGNTYYEKVRKITIPHNYCRGHLKWRETNDDDDDDYDSR